MAHSTLALAHPVLSCCYPGGRVGVPRWAGWSQYTVNIGSSGPIPPPVLVSVSHGAAPLNLRLILLIWYQIHVYSFP